MLLVKNKRASFDYEISSKLTAGIQLTGAEVKSLRLKQASLTGAYVQIVHGEAVLLGAQITPYKFATNPDYDPVRTRRLLLRRSEIARLSEQVSAKHYTLVPLAFVLEKNKIKLEIGVGRGRAKFEKRDKLKRREWEKEKTALKIR